MTREITEPKLFKFTREGDSTSGTLVDIETINLGPLKTPTPRYPIEDETGELFYVASTVDLRKKIRRVHIGRKISIKWETTKQLPNASHPMRIFKVLEL
jgi:hypothetical protein